MRIKPKAGLKIRDHFSRQILPDDGIDIQSFAGMPAHPYWQRLLRDGDVVEVPSNAPAFPASEGDAR